MFDQKSKFGIAGCSWIVLFIKKNYSKRAGAESSPVQFTSLQVEFSRSF